MIKRRFSWAFALLICSFSAVSVRADDTPESLSAYISREYVDANIKEDAVEGIKLTDSKLFGPLSEDTLPIPKTKEACQHLFPRIACTFESSTTKSPRSITPTILEKMEIVKGGGTQKNQNVVNTLFQHTQTKAGMAWAIRQFVEPITDLTILEQRKELLSLLVNDNAMRESLTNSTKTISLYEKDLCFFWTGKTVSSGMAQLLYHRLIPSLDRSEIAYEVWRFQDRLPAGMFLTWLAYSKIKHGVPLSDQLMALGKITTECFKQYPAATSCFVSMYSFIGYATYNVTKMKSLLVRNAQKTLMDTARYFDTIRSIRDMLEKNPELIEHLPRLACLRDIDNTSKHSDDFNYVIQSLQTDTFKGEPSYVCSQIGRILKTYKILPEITKELEPIIAAISELDAYVGLANRFKELEGTDNQLCFATFVEGKAHLEAKNFWNPSVLYHKEHVIPNDIIMTRNGSNKPNIVVTGPNTGGKSTILKGLFLNILLAQTFGIAAADSFTVSPFTLLNCYLNITDDIAAGISLFKAEVLRARELVEGIRSLKPGELSFTIMDETFSGTSPKEGEEASFKFAQTLGNFENSICILATHYHKLIDLEKETNNFANMHVEVIRNNDNSLTFTYKIKDGPSRMNIAMDILSEQGII